jgi:hypothetical protein
MKENSFDPAGGGMSGALNVQPSLGTHSAPMISGYGQNGYFDPNSTGQPDTRVTDTSGSFDQDVEQLFKQKEKPTPDDIMCGIEYELHNMVHRDKRIAKERVIDNLKKHGPKYYTKLNMLNIDDKEMDPTDNFQESVNLLNKMISEKNDRRKDTRLNDAIQDILNEKRARKSFKSDELLKRFH